jgi:NADH-quinone oxidoreductase subunit M
VQANLLNWILWLPILGMIGVLFAPKQNHNVIRWIALISTAVTFILTLVLYHGFDLSLPGIQPSTMVSFPWIKEYHINYTLGIDGISLPMIILNALLFFLCVMSSWTIEKSVKAYFGLLLFRFHFRSSFGY